MFFLSFVTKFEYKIQKLYWVWETPTILFSRHFENLGYLEKLFLVVFYRDKMYAYSIANVSDESDIFEYRQKHYPILFLFNNYYDRQNYQLQDLNFLLKQYKFFKGLKMSLKYESLIKFFFKNSGFLNRSSNFICFLSFQKILISLYYNTIGKKIFFYFDNYNLIYLNFWTFLLLNKCKKKLHFFNLGYYTSWYIYMFDKNISRTKYKLVFSKWNLKMKELLKIIKIYNFFKFFLFYHVKYKLNKIFLSIKLNPSKALRKNTTKWPNIKIKPIFKTYFTLIYPTRFKDSSNVKNVSYKNIENYSFFYIRKNRIFNKGRYSRNRQLYRTGVYWCLWLNIIVVYGLYFLFYRFSFNFGYVWLGMFFLILSTIFSRMFKYNFYNIFFLYSELINFKDWLSLILIELITLSQNIFYGVFSNHSVLGLFFKKRRIFYIDNKINYYIVYFFTKSDYIFNLFWKSKKFYVWEYMGVDDSLFKYRTLFHWVKQIYRSIMI